MITTQDDAPPAAAVEVFSSEVAAAQDGRTVASLDTTEIRWFALGRPPDHVIAWFSDGGTTGTTEERFDVYHLTGRGDVGTKRRSRRTVEVKVRVGVDGVAALGAGLEGPLEEWTKWAPAEDDPMWPSPDARRVEVHKTVLTRTFRNAGTEVVGPASFDDHTFAGCDVEIAVLTVGADEIWTMAFEAFGPRSSRRRSVYAAWSALTADVPAPADLGHSFGAACGYAEWLENSAS